MLDGEGLHDHAAHRQAHHVGPLHPERVEHRHDIGGHVGERVRDLRRFTLCRAATTPITSGATSEKWVDRPTSRLSMRTTWKPLSTKRWHHSVR